MSSLWTPGGEYPVDRDRPGPSGAPDDDDGDGLDDELDADEVRARAAEMQAEMDEVQARLARVPAVQVIATHAMGLYELAAIHLSQDPPNLGEAVLAIDAMATIVEGLAERLGELRSTLDAALSQIRMAFVQVKASASTAAD